MLSEIEQQAQSNLWLCDLQAASQQQQLQQHDQDNSTQTTEETEDEQHDAATATATATTTTTTLSQATSLVLPPFALLYVFWRPDMTDDPAVFVETVLLDAVVHQIQNQANVQLVNSLQEEQKCKQLRRRSSSGSLLGGADLLQLQQSRSQEDSNNTNTTAEDGTTTTSKTNKSSLYLVVDRLMPTPVEPTAPTPAAATTTADRAYRAEEDRAERLARAVAAHPVLRNDLEGITVGLSNHPRAAPALEACVDAVAVGAPDRRRHCGGTAAAAAAAATTSADNDSDNHNHNLDPQKSLLGVVALGPEDLLGLQDANVTDAAQGVRQAKITAEWNGNGNLTSFAQRAHRQWCRRNGLAAPPAAAEADAPARRRKLPKRLPRAVRLPGGNRPPRRRGVWLGVGGGGGDVLAVAYLLAYIVFHFFREEFISWVHWVLSGVLRFTAQIR